MVPSPCLQPKVIKDHNGGVLHVPCGHCDACLANKGFSRSERLSQVFRTYQYRFFVTLTYDNDSLPIAKLDGDTFYHPYDCDYNGVVYHAKLSLEKDVDASFLDEQFTKFGGVNVLSHRDIINFKKRLRSSLRYYLSKNHLSYEPLFTFVCAEYGSTTYRPHYHCLFGTNSRIIADILREHVFKAWMFRCQVSERRFIRKAYGHIDFQTVVGSDPCTYVAQYLNCTCNLPSVIAQGAFRPFHVSSVLTDARLSTFDRKTIEEYVSDLPVSVSVQSTKDSTCYDIPIPSFIENRYFPKFVGFSHVPSEFLYSLYVCPSFFYKEEFVEWYYHILTHFNELDGVPGSLEFILYQLYCPIGFSPFTLKNNLLKLWYVSRRFVENARRLHISKIEYVQRIELYYQKKSLDKLRRFYEMQIDLLNEKVPLSSLMGLYYDTDNYLFNMFDYARQFNCFCWSSLSKIPSQRKYSITMKKIVLDTTKTKKRNDYFIKSNRRLPRYKAIMPNYFSKFY